MSTSDATVPGSEARRWLVTGGCGFIGLTLMRELVALGHAVRVFDNLSVGSRGDLGEITSYREVATPYGKGPEGVELVVGDIRDAARVGEAMAGIDVVVHLAAQTGVLPSIENPIADFEHNVVGLLNVLLAARDAEVQRFVFASSNAPMGEQDSAIDETQVPRPLSPYGASKACGEAYCSAFTGSYDLPTVALRFANAYGPYCHKKGSVVARFFRRALAGEPLVIYGDGGQTRDFVHTRDLAQAIVRAAQVPVTGEVFQIASGRETSVAELARMVARVMAADLGREVPVIHEPGRKGEVKRSLSNIGKAGRALGYVPLVRLEDGLREVWEWFQRSPATTRPPS